MTSKGISPTGGSGVSLSSGSSSSHPHNQTAIDITAADLIGKLSIGNVVDLVLVSMFLLPEKMPASFQSTYTPIAAAGTPAQIEHLARLLGAQLTAAGYGKGYELMKSQQVKAPPMDEEKVNLQGSVAAGREDGLPSSTGDLESKSSLGLTSDLSDMPSSSAGVTTMSNIPGAQQRKMKPFKLVDAIKPIEYDEMQRMSTDSFNRILHSEGSSSPLSLSLSSRSSLDLDVCETACVGHVRKKTMTSLVCLSERSFRDSESLDLVDLAQLVLSFSLRGLHLC